MTRNEQAKALRAEGLSVQAIARTMGVTFKGAGNLLCYHPRRVTQRTTLRKCLCCGADFKSEGAHNRLCNRCRRQSVSPYAIAL